MLFLASEAGQASLKEISCSYVGTSSSFPARRLSVRAWHESAKSLDVSTFPFFRVMGTTHREISPGDKARCRESDLNVNAWGMGASSWLETVGLRVTYCHFFLKYLSSSIKKSCNRSLAFIIYSLQVLIKIIYFPEIALLTFVCFFCSLFTC